MKYRIPVRITLWSSKPTTTGRRQFGFRIVTIVTVLLLMGVGTSASAPESDFNVTTIFLVRHAEKGAAQTNDPDLTESGRKRAEELAHVLKDANVKAIYTSQVIRTQHTAEPLATALGITITAIPVQMSISNPREVSQESIRGITDKIYSHSGENALIVGHSNTIPEIIRALGGDHIPTIDETAYDDLFVVTMYTHEKSIVTHLNYGMHK
jgi:phosphohistidine phosphatase SixA